MYALLSPSGVQYIFACTQRMFASIMSEYNIKDFPAGPLDRYRKRASFDWREMKSFFYPKDIQEFENELLKEILENPKMAYSTIPKTLDDERYFSTKRMQTVAKFDVLKPENYFVNPEKISRGVHLLQTWEPSHVVKLTIALPMTFGVLQSLGTEKHQEFIEQAVKGEILVCFCLTEVGHGSDVNAMRTTATYDSVSKGFVLNTPDFEAAKCWAGLLGKSATHALVYAQLIVNGACHGLHTFLVPIRDPKSMLAFPGVTVGDIGEKIGLNGVDNGFVMFDQYNISRDALLNKFANVSEDGTYTTPLRNKNSKAGKSLGVLSTGRINITTGCTISLSNAVTIAIRYAAVRKQFFDPKTKEELPILEYQSLQYRLMPYLAATYALEIFSLYILKEHQQFIFSVLMGENSDLTADLGAELHAVSCASKPVSGWLVRDAIQECREACGGHGYLKSARLGDIRNFHDANLTYEGDNHVLIQQTSNWLLKLWPMVLNGERIPASLKSVSFLNKTGDILESGRFIVDADEVSKPHYILDAFQWLICYLLKSTYDKYQAKLEDGCDVFWAKNNVQIFYAKNLTTAFIQHYILQVFIEKVQEAPTEQIKNVLTQLISLYGLWSLEKHLSTLYKGGYVTGDKSALLIQETILKLCNDVKDDAVSLVDAIAVPDCVLNSVLGKSDGLVYKHLQTSFLENPDAFVRPEWWREVIKQKTELVSKL